MKKVVAALSCILFLLFTVPSSRCFAEANSAAPYSEGITESGIISLDVSPVQVKKETLTFYGPGATGKENEKDGQYLTAEYTFYNPTDMDIVSRAVFPLGTNERSSLYEERNEGYGVKIDGESVSCAYRCSFWVGQFDYENAVKELKDEYVTDDFFTPETDVYIYRCKLSSDKEVFVSASFKNKSEQKIMLSASSYSFSEKETRLGVWTSEDFYFYSFGQPVQTLPVFTAYENGTEEKIAECRVAVTLDKVASFLEVVGEKFDDERFSLTDRYNTVVAVARDSGFAYESKEYGIYGWDIFNLAQTDALMWYEYSITFPQKSQITNTVTAPLVSKDLFTWEPTIHTYSYLWSPAKTWASFSDLTVNIVTSYYLLDGYTDFDFQKTENGYTLHLDTLPKDGELEFGLCSSLEPIRKSMWKGDAWSILSWVILGGMIIGGIAVFTLIVIVVCSAVSAVKRRKSK